jgi:hypothetical protein
MIVLESSAVPNQSPTKPVVPGFRSELLSGQWTDNAFQSNRPEFAKSVVVWGVPGSNPGGPIN